MTNTQETLERETKKWLEKLEEQSKKIEILDPKAKNEVVNIKSYLSDAKHFLEKKDFVRSFEAVVYAYGILDSLDRMKMIKH